MSMSEEQYLTLRIDLAGAESALEQEERRAREKQNAQRVQTLRNQLREMEAARQGGVALLLTARGLRPGLEKHVATAHRLRLQIVAVGGQLAESLQFGNRARQDEICNLIADLVSNLRAPHKVALENESRLAVEVKRFGLEGTPLAAEARALAGLADPRWELPGDELSGEVRLHVGQRLGEAGQYHRP